jgi:uncharacterized membrane protein YcaP (DUF421 family)
MLQLSAILGPDSTHLLWWQETIRAVIVFAVGLGFLRASGLRTFSRFSPLDTVVAIIIGSNLSRALTGNAPFVSTLIASLVFVLLHRLLAQAVLHIPGLSKLLKGRPKVLIENGVLQRDAMRAEAITSHDLEEAMRLRGFGDLSEVTSAVLERNGSISLRKSA